MTHVTTNVLARINLNIDQFFNRTSAQSISVPSAKQCATSTPRNIINHIYNQSNTRPSDKFSITYGFWRTLLSAISDQRLTLELLTDRPSELSSNHIWLNHERVTALLEEQNLPYSDIPPILFHIIMANTNHLYPGALIDEGSIESECSLVTHNGEWYGEHRYSFCINIKCLPTLIFNSTALADAELS